jgi:hypothetical protein
VTFSAEDSRIKLKKDSRMKSEKEKLSMILGLCEKEGLYELEVSPLYVDDDRKNTLPSWDLTLEDDPLLWQESAKKREENGMKAPTKLGVWYCKLFSITRKVGLGSIQENYEKNLNEFCDSYLVPPSQPASRRTYKPGEAEDMAELSLRFMGTGTDRLIQTLKRSRGLSPASKEKGDNVSVVPPLNFPQGKWKTGKTPKVSKGKVSNLHRASIAEVCFTDTFEVKDNTYRYAQVFVDYRSRYGDVIPLRSRKRVGWSFGEFCCRHYTPLILIRDNIAENSGGALMEECHKRGVKSCFSCPYKPQQDYAEGYIGRVTMMASFAMVLSGAPLWMWRWAIQCAAFVNNITATHYKKEGIWGTPWELQHGEPFPDSSIVVPFGCAALVMLTKGDREKFKMTCAMMVFIHYALDHPLYTYAFFSPRTKKVVFRQDVIFLPATFPMREARTRVGMIPDGEILTAYRPRSVFEEENVDVSFGEWKDQDPLPSYQDHITGFNSVSPPDDTSASTPEKPDTWPRHYPSNPAFGPPSVVGVIKPWLETSGKGDALDLRKSEESLESQLDARGGETTYGNSGEKPPRLRPRRVREKPKDSKVEATKRKANERWTYVTVPEPEATKTTQAVARKVCKEVEMDVKEDKKFFEAEKGENHQFFDLPDQLELSPVFEKEKNGTSGKSQEKLPVFNFKIGPGSPEEVKSGNICTGNTSCTIPDTLGPVESLPEYLGQAEDNEEAAWDLQGLVFNDDDIGWCTVTGWGVDHGTNIIFYAPVESDDPVADEEHASLAEVLGWIKQSPVCSRISDYKSSRILKRSSTIDGIRTLMMRKIPRKRQRPVYGTMHIRNAVALGTKVKAMSSKLIVRILKAQETLFKYGTFIPRNDREAENSPEASRWRSGRSLEWLRLRNANTFETDWTWERIRKEFPSYQKSDVGHMFYVYDYKFSGEHRVRLVFDGSKQSPTTYSVTYAPTVRAESVRLFHLYAVEYSWEIQQYDVPQAFLRSDADCTIFVHPPKGQSDFPGQLLKLSKMLYGSKQAAALWFNLLNTFLLKLGFQASSMDPCFYRRACKTDGTGNSARSDAIIILHVDDMRVAAPPDVLRVIHDQLFQEFQITTSDTGRFLGMDVEYDINAGKLKMHMATYIESTIQRFKDFDLSKGLPYRELVGSLLWIVLCVIGPELLRVKDLAKRSNSYTMEDYTDALKVLDRIVDSKHHGILFRRGGATKEYVPANSRLGGGLEDLENVVEAIYSIGDEAVINELEENNLYKLDSIVDDSDLDIVKTLADVNARFTKVAYSDASFAVGETKQSISGFVVMINGVPILWGSLKQTVVVDSTCSAEYVAASVCCKQIRQAENMVQFLDFSCPKPYRMYTDSQACLKIATNASKMGMVRHLEIRYHLVRCVVLSGDILLEYCITEEMLADLFTKIVTTAQDKRLAVRFYNDCIMDDH